MALTLVEALKGTSNLFTQGVIQTFLEDARLMQLVPYREITGNADGILQEEVLPDADSRGVNEAFVESEGRHAEIIQSLKISGGDIGIDPFILRTKGADEAGRQAQMKMKAIRNKWMLDFFKGDSGANPRDFDGLQNRLLLGSFNVVAAGATAGGDPLSLTILDEAITRAHRPMALLLGRQMFVRFQQAVRTSTLSGIEATDRDAFGRVIFRYNGLEMVPVTDNSMNDNILPFTEAAPGGGGSTASSIYIVGFGGEGIEGIQNGGIQVRDLGESNTTPRENVRVEWYNNFHIRHPRSVIRIRGISNAPFVS